MLSNGEGFLMGIINGFGNMANRYIEDDAAVEKQRKLEEIKAQIREQELRTQTALELEFAPQKAQVAADIKETARKNEVGIVNEALEKRAENAVQKEYADPVMGDTPLTDDQQSVLNDGMAKNVREREGTRDGVLNSSMERMKAAGDAGLKMDDTAVKAENKETELGIREAGVKAQEATNEKRAANDAARAAETARHNEKMEALSAENANLRKLNYESSGASKLDSAINAAGQLLESAKSKAAARIPKDVLGQPVEDINAYLAKDEGVKAAEKRLQDLIDRQQKAFDAKAPAQTTTPSATPASQAASSGFKTPTTNDEIKSYPKGTRFFANGRMWVK